MSTQNPTATATARGRRSARAVGQRETPEHIGARIVRRWRSEIAELRERIKGIVFLADSPSAQWIEALDIHGMAVNPHGTTLFALPSEEAALLFRFNTGLRTWCAAGPAPDEIKVFVATRNQTLCLRLSRPRQARELLHLVPSNQSYPRTRLN